MGNKSSSSKKTKNTKRIKKPKKNLLRDYFGKDSPRVIAVMVVIVFGLLAAASMNVLSGLSYAYSVSNENIVESATNQTISQLMDRNVSIANAYTCSRDLSNGQNVLTFTGSIDFNYDTVPGNYGANPSNGISRFNDGINLNNVIFSAFDPLSPLKPETKFTSDTLYVSGTTTRFRGMPNINDIVAPSPDGYSTFKLPLYDNSVTPESVRCPQSQDRNDRSLIYAVWDSNFSAYINDSDLDPISCASIKDTDTYTNEQAYQICGWRIAMCIPNPFKSSDYVEVTHSKLQITW